MRRIPSYGLTAAVVAVAVTTTACAGQSGGGQVVARAGGESITRAAVAHWMQVLAPQHLVPRPPHDQALRRQALDFLISSNWLLGEAAQQGTPVAEREVERRLREKEGTFPRGHSEFVESLRAIDHTLADVKLEIADELAAPKIERRLAAGEALIAAAEIAGYYRRNIGQFEHAETRRFYIVENIPTREAAQRRMREFVRGQRSISRPGESLSELLERPHDMGGARTIVKAIFAIKPEVVSEPVRVERFYFLVQVAKVTPARALSLAEARETILTKLAAQRRQRTLARFVAAWRRKWTAKTTCSAGYVVQKCREYDGVRAREAPLSLT